MNRSEKWDRYFMEIAYTVATLGTCNRARVGTVLVRDNRILATGFNGSVAGHPHCEDVDHLIIDGHCQRTIHSEVNAIIQCALHGVTTVGSTIYGTHSPCLGCTKVLLNAGVVRFVYAQEYRPDPNVTLFLSRSNIILERVSL